MAKGKRLKRLKRQMAKSTPLIGYICASKMPRAKQRKGLSRYKGLGKFGAASEVRHLTADDLDIVATKPDDVAT